MPKKTNASAAPRKTTPPPSARPMARKAKPAKPAAPTAAARLALAKLNVRENRRVLRLVRQAETLARQTDRAYERAEQAGLELLHALARRSDRVVTARSAIVQERRESAEREQTIAELNRRIGELETELSNATATLERAIADGAEISRHVEAIAEQAAESMMPPADDAVTSAAAAGKR